MTTSSLLPLLQLADSLFPSGAFTHSYGLEQLAREGRLRRPEQIEGFIRSVLSLSAATADAVAARRAGAAARREDLDGLIELDRALLRTRSAAELRNASLTTGRRIIEETAPHLDSAVLIAYAAQLRTDRTLGLQPIAFGAVCGALDVGAEEVAPALLFGAANALLQASMRLLPVSHRDVQAILHRLRPLIVELAQQAALLTDLRSFQPLQEIASMRHATSDVRLFAS